MYKLKLKSIYLSLWKDSHFSENQKYGETRDKWTSFVLLMTAESMRNPVFNEGYTLTLKTSKQEFYFNDFKEFIHFDPYHFDNTK